MKKYFAVFAIFAMVFARQNFPQNRQERLSMMFVPADHLRASVKGNLYQGSA